MVHVVSEPRLVESYRTCRRLQRRHDPTYCCATRFLPRDVQPAVHALYGFVRGADQIVDGPRRPPGPERREALDAWQAELERGLAAGRSEHPVIAALVDAGPRHGLGLGRPQQRGDDPPDRRGAALHVVVELRARRDSHPLVAIDAH